MLLAAGTLVALSVPWLFGERARAATTRLTPPLLAVDDEPALPSTAPRTVAAEAPVKPPPARASAARTAKPAAKPARVARAPAPKRRPQKRSAALRSRRRETPQLAARGSYYRAEPVYVREANRTPPEWGETALEPTPGMPVVGVDRFSLSDTFSAWRSGGRRHRAIDIMAPRGTTVVAAEDGLIKRVARSGMAGLYVTQLDRSGQFTYFYAHLDDFVDGLFEGLEVSRGDPLGFVGTTGNAPENCPHLHFAITRVESPRRWWRGSAVNPYPLLAGLAEP